MEFYYLIQITADACSWKPTSLAIEARVGLGLIGGLCILVTLVQDSLDNDSGTF